MNRQINAELAACTVLVLAACTPDRAAPVATAVAAPAAVAIAAPSGERLAYVVGCVHCHHQLPKQIMDAPSLALAQTYSLPEFRTLLRTGSTRDGRDLFASGSAMGFAARKQLSYLQEEEVAAIHRFLSESWTPERVAAEEAKVPPMPGPPPGV